MKWYWKVLIAVFFIGLFASFSADWVAERIADQQLHKIQKQFNGKYEFTYDKLDVNVFRRRIVLENFKFYSLVDSNEHKLKIDLALDRLNLHVGSYIRLVVNGKLVLRQIDIVNPTVSYGLVAHHEASKTVTSENASSDTTDEDVFLKYLIVKSFNLENGSANIYRLAHPDRKILLIDDLNISMTDINVDFTSDSVFATSSFDEFIWSASNVTNTDLKDHELSIENIYYDVNKKGFSISKFHLANSKSPEAFNENREYRAPWIKVDVEKIKFNIHPLHFFKEGFFQLGTIELFKPEITIYVDLNHPLTPDVKPMPSKMIRSVPEDFILDSLKIRDGTFVFKPKMKGEFPGMVKHSPLNGHITHITNISELLENDPNMYLEMDTKIWDEGIVKLNMEINIPDINDEMKVDGTVRDLSLKKSEYLIENLFGVGVESGHLDLLEFHYVANDIYGQGKTVFNYSDLVFDLKKEDKKLESGDEKVYDETKSHKFLNFLVNSSVRENNMPGDKKYNAEGFIYHERERNKAFSAMLWECIQTGIIDVVVKDSFFNAKKKHNRKQKKEVKAEEKEEKKENNEQKSSSKKKKKRKKKKTD